MRKNQRLNSVQVHCKLTKPLPLGLIALVSISLLLSLISPSTHAAGVVGNGSAGSCTDAALNAALSGGGAVTFNCGSLPKTILIGSEKAIAANTSIDGRNLITLSGGNSVRLFNVKPNTRFTVSNLTLANGHTAGQGGAIHSASFQNTILTVNHCDFINNVSSQIGEAGGGAIYSGSGYLTVDRSSFTGNRAGTGGAIRVVQSNLTVTASTFTNNKAVNSILGDGGAIHIDGAKTDNGKIIISTSTFKGNYATFYGGAVFNNILNNNTTTITDSLFSGNSAGIVGKNGQGGAIWSTGDPKVGGQWIANVNNTTLTIANCTIAGNIANQQGGGVWVARHPKGTAIYGSAIYGNTAVNSMGGGVVQAETGKITVQNSTISDNKGKGPFSMGGGIYVGRNAKAAITNTTIANNVANWQGGGIFGGLNVMFKNSILANNVALNGGNAWNIKHNCFLPMTNGGNNLQFPSPIDADCTVGILIADPRLGAIGNNGGRTYTKALLPGSPASRNAIGCPATDQRGVKRPNPVGTDCDIGAYEASF